MSVLASLFALAVALASGTRPVAHRHPIVTDTTIEVLDPVRFVGDTAAITPTSGPLLDALARTLIGNPSLEVLEVTVNAQPTHPGLAAGRAAAVIAYLVEHGVAASRLRPAVSPTPFHGPGQVAVVVARRAS
jgi:outer membrane protein OmpA-like peptidoglycan-associated protein